MPEIRASRTAAGTTVEITLSHQEAALVHHVRGNCHDSNACALCTAQRDLHNTRREAERDRERALVRCLDLLSRAHRAEDQLEQIISG